MAKFKLTWTLLVMVGLCLAQPLLACWQTTLPPIRITNDRVRVRFTHMGKPLEGAVAFLSNQKRTVSLRVRVGEDGWVRFPKVPGGKYKLVMDGPSHETFDVQLKHSDANAQGALISFSEDYRASVSPGDDPMFYDF